MASLLAREFVAAGRAASSAPSFRVLQFNCLADHLSDAFPLVDKRFLSWEHRAPLLLDEIVRAEADFVCLEEVDHFADVLEPALAAKGYAGHFKCKPGGKDGCALFYRTDTAELLSLEEVEYASIARLANASQVALVGVFRHIPSLRRLCVTVTHLKAKEEFEDVRAVQADALLRHLHDRYALGPCLPLGPLVPRPTAPAHPDTAFVVAGDLNTEPTGKVYPRMLQGLVGDGYDIPLKSAYSQYGPSGGEPAYTTWKIRPPHEACRTIDYIFHSAHVRPVRLLSIPTPDAVPPSRLPSEHYPSDHFAICCEFAFAQKH